MKILDYHGTTVCLLNEDEMLDGSPMLSYAVFEDFGRWLAVKIWPGIAIPLHTDPLEAALDEIAEHESLIV
ncbi:hypothetical protein [Dickeya chrysanthemi]|uniref:hypothetical protein n=1 Tax=Dickeya chrysanthemi TaxID=556 RepID=UPI0008FC1AA7|nr:hypothetical protein [Dickeya chrysanthemi]